MLQGLGLLGLTLRVSSGNAVQPKLPQLHDRGNIGPDPLSILVAPSGAQMTSLSYTYPISQINNVLAWWLPWITSPPAPFGNAIELTNIPGLGNTVTVQTFVLVPNTTDVVAKLNQQAEFAASTGCVTPSTVGLGYRVRARVAVCAGAAAVFTAISCT